MTQICTNARHMSTTPISAVMERATVVSIGPLAPPHALSRPPEPAWGLQREWANGLGAALEQLGSDAVVLREAEDGIPTPKRECHWRAQTGVSLPVTLWHKDPVSPGAEQCGRHSVSTLRLALLLYSSPETPPRPSSSLPITPRGVRPPLNLALQTLGTGQLCAVLRPNSVPGLCQLGTRCHANYDKLKCHCPILLGWGGEAQSKPFAGTCWFSRKCPKPLGN